LSAPQERDFIKMNLGPTLEKAGYTHDKFKIMIFDDGANTMKSWADTILSDKEAAKHVSGIAYHWYSNHKMSGFPEEVLEDIHKKYSDFSLLILKRVIWKALVMADGISVNIMPTI